MKRKAKSKPRDPDLDVEAAETLIWTCSACGADNPDSRQKCISCGGDRAGDAATSKPREPADDLQNYEAPQHETMGGARIPAKPSSFSTDSDEEEPESSPFAPQSEVEKPELWATETPGQEEKAEQPSSEPEITPFLPTPTPFSQPSVSKTISASRFFIVFVNTPAASLIKSKVPIEFEDFPVVSIGRSPENVIVIPDPEVSRKHAELTMTGNRLMLKDLNSKNGTYLYTGKEFEQVHDSVEVKPNSIVKFGTGTIVRLTGE